MTVVLSYGIGHSVNLKMIANGDSCESRALSDTETISEIRMACTYIYIEHS